MSGENKADLSQEDLWRIRAMLQRTGWARFLSHIGSIMAEQADKVKRDSEQDKTLFRLSTLFHGELFREEFAKCGFFDYRPFIEMDWVPKEFVHLFAEAK